MDNKGKINLNDYIHVGIIVKSIENTLEDLKEIFNVESYRVNLFPPENLSKDDIQLMYKGKKTWFTAKFCFIKLGNFELELIEPVDGDSVWKDFLNEHGEGVHHLKFEVDSLNDTIQYYKNIGIDCTQYGSAVGPNLGKTWAYFNTFDKLGYVVEVLNRQVGEKIL